MHFFAKYITENEVESFASKIFNEAFQAMYSCNYIGKYSSARTIIIAIDDALNGVRGKAEDNKILSVEKIRDRFGELISAKKEILILNNSSIDIVRNIVNKIKKLNSEVNLKISSECTKELEKQFSKYEIVELKDVDLKKYETTIQICTHIFDVRNELKDGIFYVDKYLNTIISEEDKKYVNNYDNVYNLLKNTVYPVLVSKIRKMIY